MITVKGLAKYYQDVKAVDGIDFTVNDKEIIGILGPNGAGKTTTLRMLTCFLTPTRGEVIINGLKVEDNPVAVKNLIGYLPEAAPLYPDMVVYDYLVYSAEVRGVEKEKIPERIEFVTSKCALNEFISKKIGEISKGQKQRVGLAMTIIHDPAILILDEPTTGLDPNQIVEIRGLIGELGKEKIVILSTHILSEVEASCSRVIIMNRGKIVTDSSTRDLKIGQGKPQTITLKVRTEDSSDKALHTVEQVPGISQARLINKTEGVKEFILQSPSDTDVLESLSSALKKTDWVICELKQDTQNFESIFRELTREQ